MQLGYDVLAAFDAGRPDLPKEVREQVEIQIKYEGYIKKQQREIEESRRLEVKRLPAGVDYQQIAGLRLEAREKLQRVQPENIGQASRISGVNPADITTLLIWLEVQEKEKRDD